MHGGAIYLRGGVKDYQLGKEVGVTDLTEKDHASLDRYVREYSAHFDCDVDTILKGKFIKLFPLYLRPYGRLYAY
jgi:glutamate synthase domain-containing protein 3